MRTARIGRAVVLCAICLVAARAQVPVDPETIVPIAPPTSPKAIAPIPQGALSDRIVSYTIQATLDPAEGVKTVTGRERVTWRNPSDVPVGELQFHLYLNGFRDRESTFMRESGGQLRGDFMREERLGNIEVTSMKTAAGDDLLAALEFIHPDDDNANDKSVARVPLPKPVAPGATIELDVEFTSKLPGVFARTGYEGNFFLVAQWFPKLGVVEPRGVRGREEPGWNCHQFHANSEFYADFGTYDVTLTVPSNFVVGATGVLAEKRVDGANTVYHYQQADVHDFAWTADDDYVVGTRTYSENGFPAVEITALVQPEHRATVERHLDACEKSIRWFNHNVGTYPYSVLTVVDPQAGAGGAGGMEYPTFITAGVELAPSNGSPAPDDPLLEIVIAHEFGHQYWYGMVASNEFEEPWMDEGINSYSEQNILTEVWPDSQGLYVPFAGVNLFRVPIPHPEIMPATRYAALPFVVRRGAIVHKSWGFDPGYSYGLNSYRRPATTLKTLEGYLGRETMDRVMKTYFERWKFRHPTSQDFFDVAEEVAGQDLTWFFDQYFRSSRVLDYAVRSVTRGDGGKTEIIVERLGDGVLPVVGIATREDGTTEELSWDGRAAQKIFSVDDASPVVRVDVYGGRSIQLDVNCTNDTWVSRTDGVGPTRVASQYGLLFQHVMMLLAGAV